MSVKYCHKCFIKSIKDHNNDNVEMVMPIEHSAELCGVVDCKEQATRLIYGKGETPGIALPTRKEYIIQMSKELTLAIENGCVVEFGAAEKFLPGMPQLTEYKFLIDKEMLIRTINVQEKGK